ncbi:MAG: DUF167 domain-containing protein [Acidobacteriia bacterium]|nr:DUF167 domain-containing protein [Terriglobia bacterium]
MDSARLRIRQRDSGIEVPLHVQPRARRPQIAGIHGSALKVKICAPPVDDAANRAVVEFFSALLGLPKSCLRIIAGQKSRDKILWIQGISEQGFRESISQMTGGEG